MSIKALQLIGLPLLTMDTGKQLDTVKDIIYDPSSNQVSALVVDEGGWFADAKIVMMASVVSIGQDAIMVKDENAVQKASNVPTRVANIAGGDNHLTKTKIVTQEGRDLGYVSDLYFEANGKVTELEVTEGLVANLTSGKKRVRIDDIITIGENATIVRSWVENDLHSQAQEQGLQGATKQAVAKTGDKLEQAKEKIGETWEKTKEQATVTAQNVQLQAKLGQMEVGDKISDTQAASKDKLNDLQQSGKIDQTQENIKVGAQDLGDKIKETWHKTSDFVQDKTQQATSFVQNKTQDAQDALEEKRKGAAVGKYVTVNVLDPENDEVLAAEGAMITYQLLAKAEQKGVLDKVLNNVSA